MVKNGNGYKIVSINDNGEKTIIAKLEKGKKGYTKSLYNETTKTWFTPLYFSYFPTLKAAKSYYNV